jgi:hypothetical protein
VRNDLTARLDALGGRTAPSTPKAYTAALRGETALVEKPMVAKLEAQ